MDQRDPFSFELATYIWVTGLAAFAGLINGLNRLRQFAIGPLIVACLTSSLNGLIMFWICQSMGVQGHMMAVAVAISGLMGIKAWTEFENLFRARFFGAPPVQPMDVTTNDIKRTEDQAK